jgi:GT2 family glycosyltransferase
MTSLGTPKVAIAIVSWNTRELLRSCLDSMAAAFDSGIAEVWVVDNASADGSPDMVERDFPWVRLLRQSGNPGFGAAVNEVAAHTRTPWFAPSNADVELTPGALEALLEAGEVDGRTAVIAPRLKLADGSTQHSVHSFPSLRLALAHNLGLGHIAPRLGDRLCLDGFWNPDRARAVDWAHGAFLLIRRDAFDAIGGFDRRQWMYAEDLDIAWRVDRAGWTTWYEPAAVVRHRVSAAATQAFGEDRLERHVAASYAWMARRRGLTAARTYAAVNVAGCVIRWLAFSPLARVRPGRWGAASARSRRYAATHARALRSSAS